MKSFRLAPHLGLFAPGPGLFHQTAGLDPVDQIAYIADQGFTAITDNFLLSREPRDQDRIGAALAKRGLEMGSFVAIRVFDRPLFGSEDSTTIAFLKQCFDEAIEAGKRVNGRWFTTIPGLSTSAPIEAQTQTALANLNRCAEWVERAGAVILLEALNSTDRPGMLFPKITEVAKLVAAVGSPACRALFDVYHVQVESGDLIRNIDRCWSEIGYVQIGDNPGRCEPGTGEINFARVLSHLHKRGYRGLIDMEHKVAGDGAAGEAAMLHAYRQLEKQANTLLTQ
jgi:hydroxypyruvate isomerase